jgi:crotonobetainyl-CoA:carnitine CoA-transferase CaiB-like acyl-CoA transferase
VLGEHNDYVFGDLLGMSKDEIARLVEEGVFE